MKNGIMAAIVLLTIVIAGALTLTSRDGIIGAIVLADGPTQIFTASNDIGAIGGADGPTAILTVPKK